MSDHEGTLQIKVDDITMKTKRMLTRFGGILECRDCMKNPFLILYWVVHNIEITNLLMPFMLILQAYTLVKKSIKLSTNDKLNLNCDITDGSVVIGSGQPMLYSSKLGKPPRYKVFCQPETTDYKKINKSVLNSLTFYLEDDDHEEFKFNAKTLTFILELVKI